jgi:hypothetical protein
MKTAFLGLVLALPLAACVSSGPESQLGKKEPQRIKMLRTSDCVFGSSISDFHVLDDSHVVLYGMGGRKAYLAEIVGACFDLKYEHQLATVDGDRNGQICGYGRDSLAFRRMGILESCRIFGMEELSEERRLELGLAKP